MYLPFFNKKNDTDKKLKMIRAKRNGVLDKIKTAGLIIAALILICGIIAGVRACSAEKPEETKTEEETSAPVAEVTVTEPPTLSAEEIEESERAEEEARIDAEKTAVIDSYSDLGIVKVNDGGYLNIRKEPNTKCDIIGTLNNNGACEILSSEGDWVHIVSNGIDGYVSSQFLLTGDDARSNAKDAVRKMARVVAEKLNIRSGPGPDNDAVGTALAGERYEVLGEENGWLQIPQGYISGEYAETGFMLEEAKKLDMKAMVLNLYDTLGMSDVSNYLNIREKPGEKEKIIGKLMSNAACDILGEDNGWYFIRSGKIKGYVKADYILTGDAAKEKAMSKAELMAIVNTDVLNVRSEPNTSSKIWTQISNSERYPVVEQLDGWVKIELEEDTFAYASTEFCEVRYALNEAIKFSPLEIAAANSDSRRASVVNYALKFLGNPYVWGGTSLTRGCDCSGFTMGVLGNFGVRLPHYSGDQAKMGRGIKSSEMRPGDLIFYANSSGKINHVAIYIGNGQIVHAASRRSGIKISNWNYRSPKAIRSFLD